MTKSTKILIGIFSILPIILFGIYMILAFSMFFSIMQHPMQLEDGNFPPSIFFRGMIPAFIVALLMGLTALGLLIYYIIHVVNNKNIDSTERLIWILVFIFAGMVGFPIYWYMRIWKTPTPQMPSAIS
jgi:Phospholipase_D-nuclease N-terminal